MRPLRLQEKELAYLTDAEVALLFQSIHTRCKTPHVAMAAAICLATGARWGEAQALVPERVRSGVSDIREHEGEARQVDSDRSYPGTEDLRSLQATRFVLELPEQL